MQTKDDNLLKKIINKDYVSPLKFIANSFVLSALRTPLERLQILNQNKNFLKTFGLVYKNDAHIIRGKLSRNKERRKVQYVQGTSA